MLIAVKFTNIIHKKVTQFVLLKNKHSSIVAAFM